MELETLRRYLLGKRGAVEEFPFGPDTLVFKVMGRMFALIALEDAPLRLNLKCDPGQALALRDFYRAVIPGYHMNKRHWNTIVLDGSIPDDELLSMVDDSYVLVVRGLKRADRQSLQG